MMAKIRNMVDADLPSVRPLLRQLGYDFGHKTLEERFRFVTNSPDHQVFVSEIDGKLTGFIHIYGRPALEKPIEAVVQAMVIDEAYRHAGIGSDLMEAAEEWATAHGYRSVVLYTHVDREDAHTFYLHLGYCQEATSHFLRKENLEK